MAEKLEGLEFRVFQSLLEEHHLDRIEDIRIELTRGPEASSEEIEETLHSLREKEYVEEHAPGRWRVTNRALAVKRSLLGKPIPE